MEHTQISVEIPRAARARPAPGRRGALRGPLKGAALVAVLALALPSASADSGFEAPDRPAAHAGVQPATP